MGSNTTRTTTSLVQRHVEDEPHGVVMSETGFLKLAVTCKEGGIEWTCCTCVCNASGPSCGKEDVRPSRGKVGKHHGLKLYHQDTSSSCSRYAVKMNATTIFLRKQNLLNCATCLISAHNIYTSFHSWGVRGLAPVEHTLSFASVVSFG